jgi:hypothetical protein
MMRQMLGNAYDDASVADTDEFKGRGSSASWAGL